MTSVSPEPAIPPVETTMINPGTVVLPMVESAFEHVQGAVREFAHTGVSGAQDYSFFTGFQALTTGLNLFEKSGAVTDANRGVFEQLQSNANAIRTLAPGGQFLNPEQITKHLPAAWRDATIAVQVIGSALNREREAQTPTGVQ